MADKLKKPVKNGLERAKALFEKLYRKKPSEELIKIISEIPANEDNTSDTPNQNDDIAAKKPSRPQESVL